MAELNVGAAKVDITPVTSCWMEGYRSRKENGPMSTGVYDRLHARALVAEGGGDKVAVVSCDLCALDPDTINDVRRLVGDSIGMPPEHGMVFTTHNHSGPVTDYPHGGGAPKTNLEWLEGLAHKIAEVILLANVRLEPAKVGVVRGTSATAMNRQQSHEDGGVTLGQAPEKPTDPEVISIMVDSPRGTPIARVVNYGCHNTSLGPKNTRISGDYAGRSMTALEDHIGEGAVCLFVNGGSGNIDPFHRVLDDAADPRVQEVADVFTRDVLKAWDQEVTFRADAHVGGMFYDLALPRKRSGIEAGLGRMKRIRAQTVRIGDVVLLGSPNEIVCEIVMNIKRQSPARDTLVGGYCYNAIGPWHPHRDGMGGYLPAASHYEHGGYEVASTPYAPEAEEVYTRGMVELVAMAMHDRA